MSSSAAPAAPAALAVAWLAELAKQSGDVRARSIIRLLGRASYNEQIVAVNWPTQAALVERLLTGDCALTARLFGVAFIYLDSGDGAMIVDDDDKINTTSARAPDTERLRLICAPRTIEYWRVLRVAPKFTFVQIGDAYYSLCPSGLVVCNDARRLIHSQRRGMRATALAEAAPAELAEAIAGYVAALDYWEIQDANGRALLKMDYGKVKD